MAAGRTTRAPLASSCSTSPERRSRSTITSGSRPPKITPTSFEEATMGHCYHHALSSVKKWGGTAEDYLPLHQWFDESKELGRASCRESVCQIVYISVVAVPFKKKKQHKYINMKLSD